MRAIAGVAAAGFVLLSCARPLAAAEPSVACELLTPAQIGAATGATLGAGSPVAAPTTCHWVSADSCAGPVRRLSRGAGHLRGWDRARVSPIRVASTTPLEGGHVLQALGGAKVGVRRNGYGVFGKLRAGVNSYSAAFASGDSATNAITTRRSNLRAVDVGIVVERYLPRHWLARFDGGDVITFYQPTTVTIDGVLMPISALQATDSIQVVVGIGRRF